MLKGSTWGQPSTRAAKLGAVHMEVTRSLNKGHLEEQRCQSLEGLTCNVGKEVLGREFFFIEYRGGDLIRIR